MILFVSDVHCHFELINMQVDHAEENHGEKVSQILVLGDIGAFEHELKVFFRNFPEGFKRPLAFIDGNHEDFACLPDLAEKYKRHMTYLPRATMHEFSDLKVLALGGAAYMDASVTPIGCEITSDQIEACLHFQCADVVISHDCPQNIGIDNAPGFEHYGKPGFARGLEIAQKLKPAYWFFGHHHRWFDRQIDSTRFIGLAEIWKGYAVFTDQGKVFITEHNLPKRMSWWQRLWFGS